MRKAVGAWIHIGVKGNSMGKWDPVYDRNGNYDLEKDNVAREYYRGEKHAEAGMKRHPPQTKNKEALAHYHEGYGPEDKAWTKSSSKEHELPYWNKGK